MSAIHAPSEIIPLALVAPSLPSIGFKKTVLAAVGFATDPCSTSWCGLGIVFAANARVTFNLPAPSACGPALPDASAVVAIIDFISYGVRFGFLSIRAIAAPVTCGAAKLVPLTMEYSPPTDVVLMYTPGATRSGFM